MCKMYVDAEFRADSSRGLGSFVAASVFWQIDFLYNRFSKLFSTKPANLNVSSARAVTPEPSYRRLCTSQN